MREEFQIFFGGIVCFSLLLYEYAVSEFRILSGRQATRGSQVGHLLPKKAGTCRLAHDHRL